jgi:hypothetical protein
MWICFLGHCYYIPVVIWPWGPGHTPGPGPVNYPQLIQDATIVASVNAALSNVSDEGVRGALQSGINAAVSALQKRAGGDVTIKQTAPAQ